MPEPPLKALGHGRERGFGDCRHGGSADQIWPVPGLRLEVGAGEFEQFRPAGQAKVVAAGSAAVGGRVGVGIVKRKAAGSAGVVVETNHVKNLGGD